MFNLVTPSNGLKACFVWLAITTSGFASTNPDEVRELRLAGQLQAALILAEQDLVQDDSTAGDRFELHLELARIHDRFGLHFRSRPVAAALEEIDKASKLAAALDDNHKAKAKLARATYYYRAEMAERQFPLAIELVQEAEALFVRTDDLHGQAEAVHLRGLIHLQMNELDLARRLFDESLELDIAGGERDLFRGEYERHVAFVYIFQSRPDLAIPHLERSLAARKDAGAIDASLFAANTLADQRLALEQLENIPIILKYAESVLESLDSPYGEYQFVIISGRYWLEVGNRERAAEYFRSAMEAAESIDWDAGVHQAGELLSDALIGSESG